MADISVIWQQVAHTTYTSNSITKMLNKNLIKKTKQKSLSPENSNKTHTSIEEFSVKTAGEWTSSTISTKMTGQTDRNGNQRQP